jgi:accessory gene regulator protein AgrB
MLIDRTAQGRYKVIASGLTTILVHFCTILVHYCISLIVVPEILALLQKNMRYTD